MRKTFIVIGLMIAVSVLFALPVFAQQGGGRGSGGCPWMGGGWKASRQPSESQQAQPRGRCPWMGGGWRASPQQSPEVANGPVSEKEARQLIESKIRATNNPNLKLGKITDDGDYYLAEITSQNGSLVDKWKVGKETGNVESVYQAKQ